MSILTFIKNIFGKTQPIMTNPIVYNIDEHLAKHTKFIEEEANVFIEKYGADFDTFFYRENFETFIRTEVLPFRQPDSKHNNFLDNSYWTTKHPFNFPGPFYTGESDTCGTGDIEAPNNVMYDEYAMEIVFKQPTTFEELLGVIDAAAMEVLDSYSCDGNSFWSYSKCKDWWKNRFDLISEMNKPETQKVNGRRFILFEHYLKSKAENDLKKYCYFLENGNCPNVETKALPQLE